MAHHKKLVFLHILTTVLICVMYCAESADADQNQLDFDFTIYSRSKWNARGPKKSPEPLSIDPPPYVIIHHFDTPGCEDFDSCSKRVRSFQDHHMDVNNWDDIGYNFLIGGDGAIYEGRGLHARGAHSPDYNNRSLGLCFIGKFQDKLPNPTALSNAKQFLLTLELTGLLPSDFTILGHRQTRQTECPGDALYEKIKTWSQWKNI